MQIRTATFTSVQNRQFSGYQLFNVSEGIGDQLVRQLTRWSPSHDGLFENLPQSHAFNFFQCGDYDYGFSRTCFGGPEYSGRTGLQVYTKILVLTEPEFALYSYDASAVIQRIASSGAFHFASQDTDPIDPRSLRPPAFQQSKPSDDLTFHHGYRALQLLGRDHQIAVLGIEDRLKFMSAVFDNLDRNERATMSFSTGLMPTKTRPFRIQMFNQMTDMLKNYLAKEKIPVLDCRSN